MTIQLQIGDLDVVPSLCTLPRLSRTCSRVSWDQVLLPPRIGMVRTHCHGLCESFNPQSADFVVHSVELSEFLDQQN